MCQPGQHRSWGPPPLRPLTQPAPLAPFPMPPSPVTPLAPPFQAPPAAMPTPPVTPPAAPPQYFGYPPGPWGLIPNYYPAPAQPYLISYPPGPWLPYQQYYAGQHGHVKEDSETAKPNKFTGQDPSKLHPFIISCIMAFDSQPH